MNGHYYNVVSLILWFAEGSYIKFWNMKFIGCALPSLISPVLFLPFPFRPWTFSSPLPVPQIPSKLNFPSHAGSSLACSILRMWKVATFTTHKKGCKSPLSPSLCLWPSQGSCTKFLLLPLQPPCPQAYTELCSSPSSLWSLFLP